MEQCELTFCTLLRNTNHKQKEKTDGNIRHSCPLLSCFFTTSPILIWRILLQNSEDFLISRIWSEGRKDCNSGGEALFCRSLLYYLKEY
jgi:hypothetical protein